MSNRPFAALAILIFSCLCHFAFERPVAAQSCNGGVALSGTYGSICGAAIPASQTGTNTALYSYLGIPYAMPPTPANGLRWRPPATPTPLTQFQATAYGNVCPQLATFVPSGQTAAEDCLYLNVWAPQSAIGTSAKLPVMVFIHGGAFIFGAGSVPTYDGAYLAASGNLIVVTMNYRLGSLGFLAAPGLGINGNFGLQDQQAALTWVQKNIASFGGDPTRVTLFGESAGAMSTGLHLFAMPSSQSLFAQAIMESNPMAVPYPATASEVNVKWTGFLAALCQVTTSPSVTSCAYNDGSMSNAQLAEVLQALPLATISAADASFTALTGVLARLISGSALTQALPWTPIVDSTALTPAGSLVMGQPYNGYAQGAGITPKPYIFGFNRDEGALFAGFANSVGGGKGLSSLQYSLFVAVMFGFDNASTIITHNTGTSLLNRTYPYSPLGVKAPTYYASGPQVPLSNVLNDFAFQCGNLINAQIVWGQTRGANTDAWGYVFASPPLSTSGLLGSAACTASAGNICHTAELPYVFNTLATQPGTDPTPADNAVARGVSQMWTTFANTGQPAAGWAPYSPSAFDNNVRIVGSAEVPSDIWQSSGCELWKSMPPYATVTGGSTDVDNGSGGQ